jgi:hypothetical protein
MKCCPKCFVDEVIIAFIQSNGQRGSCEYCEEVGGLVVESHALNELFYPVIQLFRPEFHEDESVNPVGSSLARCLELETGWRIFSEALTNQKRNDLLDDVRCIEALSLDEGPESVSSSDLWLAPSSLLQHAHGEYVWAEFSDAVKYKRRFRPELIIGGQSPDNWLADVASRLLRTIDCSQLLYRARLDGLAQGFVIKRPHPSENMGKPPIEKAACGRANPRGIPYLYVAESEATAVAEVRPVVGDYVSVVQITPRKPLRVLDLTQTQRINSPFGLKDIELELKQCGILAVLQRELGRPIRRGLEDIEYAPTQHLAECILNAGFDGIRYKSAMSEGGYNIVLFSDENVKLLRETRLAKVSSVYVKYTLVECDTDNPN